MNSSGLIVKASKLLKSYDWMPAVRGIDLKIPRSGCFGLLGPNGAGKTTTLPAVLQTIAQFPPLTRTAALVRPPVSGQAPDRVLLHVIVLGLFSVAGFHASVVLTRRRLIH